MCWEKSEAEFIVVGEWPKIKRTEFIFRDRSHSQGSRNHHVFGSYIAIPKPKLQSKLEASLTKPPWEGFSGAQFLRVLNCLRSLSTKCAVHLSTIFYRCKRTKLRDVSCFIISYQPVFKSLKWWHNFGRASYSPTWKESDVICLDRHFVCLFDWEVRVATFSTETIIWDEGISKLFGILEGQVPVSSRHSLLQTNRTKLAGKPWFFKGKTSSVK